MSGCRARLAAEHHAGVHMYIFVAQGGICMLMFTYSRCLWCVLVEHINSGDVVSVLCTEERLIHLLVNDLMCLQCHRGVQSARIFVSLAPDSATFLTSTAQAIITASTINAGQVIRSLLHIHPSLFSFMYIMMAGLD